MVLRALSQERALIAVDDAGVLGVLDNVVHAPLEVLGTGYGIALLEPHAGLIGEQGAIADECIRQARVATVDDDRRVFLAIEIRAARTIGETLRRVNEQN